MSIEFSNTTTPSQDAANQDTEPAGPDKPPTCLVISDPHGADHEFGQLLRHGLGMPDDIDSTADNIKAYVEKTGIDKVYVLGDLLDRGPNPPATFQIVKSVMESGKGRYVTGNHDLWAMMNLQGIHIPDDGQGKQYWAKIFAAQINHAKKQQADIWNSVYDDCLGQFEENYGVPLRKTDEKTGKVKEDGKDILNYPEKHPATRNTAINEDDELRTFWAEMLGRNVETLVYTGLRDVESMSLGWWQKMWNTAIHLAAKYSDDELLQQMPIKIAQIIQTYDKNLAAKVEEYGEDYLTVDKMMAGNYSTPEWWSYDWIRHKGWGSLDGNGLLKVLNDNRADDEPEWDYSNYYDNKTIQEFAKFYKENFNLYEIDDYGNYLLHSMLPIDNRGVVSIGKVNENGDVVTTDEDGKRIEGLYYKGQHYTDMDVFAGFDAIASDIRGFDEKTQAVSEIREAFALVNAIYADETTIIKPKMIAKNLATVGKTALENDNDNLKEMDDKELIARGLGIVMKNLGIPIIICGHNTTDKLALAGIDIIAYDDNDTVRNINTDGGMSPKFVQHGMYAKYGGTGVVGAEIYGFSGKDTPIDLQISIAGCAFFTEQHHDHFSKVINDSQQAA